MQEETGYDSEDIIPLGAIHPNPAIQGNRCHSFLARHVEKRFETNFDTTEETEVTLAPLALTSFARDYPCVSLVRPAVQIATHPFPLSIEGTRERIRYYLEWVRLLWAGTLLNASGLIGLALALDGRMKVLIGGLLLEGAFMVLMPSLTEESKLLLQNWRKHHEL